MTVSSDQRLGLARAVSGLRRLFEDDFASLARGKYGIHVDGRRAGELEIESALSLSAHDAGARAELVGVVEYLRSEGLGAPEAVERMLREAVFTTVNRILAIRVAEAIGVLPESLAKGSSSEGFLEALEVFPLLRDADHTGGYWSYLELCGDELSHAVPRLFDRRHPLSSLVPSAEALDGAIEILSGDELDGVWAEPEALGWSYQFFNTQEERSAMRDASQAPRDARELAVRNQFFTPGYVVDFLVQNTLGRRLRESGSAVKLPLLVGEVAANASHLDLAGVSVLDPAVGSGHFLLGAYGLLEEAWAEIGVEPAQAAPSILGSLFGIEIDPRAAQVAQAVLYLRARRSAPDVPLQAPAIVTARSLPKDTQVRATVLQGQPAIVRDLVEELSAALEMAPELGSLLKIEEVVSARLGQRMQSPLLGDEPSGSFDSIESAVLQAAEKIASRSAASPAERVFAADASDALRFVELCARRYDAILMNPPFGRGVAATADYSRTTYGPAARELYASFLLRGLSLAKMGGLVGAITSRSGFFLTSLAQWRTESIIPGLVAVLDLGHGVLHEALVEAAAYVCGPTRGSETVVVDRALNAPDKEKAVRSREGMERFELQKDLLRLIPGTPLAYWADPALIRLFGRYPALQGEGREVRIGTSTGNDFRFLRLAWEPPTASIGSNPRAEGGRWFPFAKGGAYSPYYDDVHLLLDWEADGKRLRATGDSPRIQNTTFFFRPGVTWPLRTTSGFGPRVMPRGCAFGHKGPAVFAEVAELHLVLAWLGTRHAQALLDLLTAAGEGTMSGTASKSYEVGLVRVLPYPGGDLSGADRTDVSDAVRRIVNARRLFDLNDELSRAFVAPRAVSGDELALSAAMAVRDSAAIEMVFSRALGIDDRVAVYVDKELGVHPGTLGEGRVDLDAVRALTSMGIDALVDAAVDEIGGRSVATKNFTIDRRLELISLMLGLSPPSIVGALDQPSAALDRWLDDSQSAISYLVGCGIGRWDVRVGRNPVAASRFQDPFDQLSVCPPGMLLGDDGLPDDGTPAGYPLSLPPGRILHDDPGHEWDVVASAEVVAEFLFDDPGAELQEALKHLNAKNLRGYLRGKFFAHHMSRYSKSRRKAPIYWYLAVPSREWGLWVYAPWLSREQLFAVARAAHDKLRRVSDQVTQLRRDIDSGEERVARERLEAAEGLARELEAFHAHAEAVAQSGWEPDLNDGIILNAAPLEDLFADPKWRKDVAHHRKKLQAGDYPWATVQHQYFARINP